MTAYSGNQMASPPSTLSDLTNQGSSLQNLDQALDQAFTHLNHALSKNHGIKEDSVVGLLSMIGVKPNDFDPTLLAMLDSFGADRGRFAHTSSVKVMQTLPDPAASVGEVQQLISMLVPLDACMNALLRSAG